MRSNGYLCIVFKLKLSNLQSNLKISLVHNNLILRFKIKYIFSFLLFSQILPPPLLFPPFLLNTLNKSVPMALLTIGEPYSITYTCSMKIASIIWSTGAWGLKSHILFFFVISSMRIFVSRDMHVHSVKYHGYLSMTIYSRQYYSFVCAGQRCSHGCIPSRLSFTSYR